MRRNDERWRRLRAHLGSLDASEIEATAGRVGAVLVLLAEHEDDLELVLTRRRDDLATHPGQVSFPGGRREAGETTDHAALREAHEEIGLRPETVQVVGRLPVFYIPPSRFWMAPVVARWLRPHPLRAQEAEVAAIVRAPLSHLLDRQRWRKVRLSVTGWSLAWQLDGGHLLWGATAMVTAVLLDAVEPAWRRGLEPSDLPDDREVTPWMDARLERRVVPARLAGVPSMPRGDVAPPVSAAAGARLAATAGAAIARAVTHLPSAPDDVVVLAGHGGNGAVGVAAAAALRNDGVPVTAIVPGPGALSAGGLAVTPFAGSLPEAGLYLDALVGGGLRGRLRGAPLDMILALRSHTAPILAVDLPSGLHPTDGLVGDLVSATVTIALDGVWPALTYVGLSPFIGDLYLWKAGADDVVRLVGGPERTATGGWRE